MVQGQSLSQSNGTAAKEVRGKKGKALFQTTVCTLGLALLLYVKSAFLYGKAVPV